jgi:hypothetical protein
MYLEPPKLGWYSLSNSGIQSPEIRQAEALSEGAIVAQESPMLGSTGDSMGIWSHGMAEVKSLPTLTRSRQGGNDRGGSEVFEVDVEC